MVYKKTPFVDENYFVYDCFIRDAPIEKNNLSECIRTVSATCDSKCLQPYKYELKQMSADRKRTANDTQRIPVYAA